MHILIIALLSVASFMIGVLFIVLSIVEPPQNQKNALAMLSTGIFLILAVLAYVVFK